MLGVRFLDVDFMRITFACASPTVYVIRLFWTVVKGGAAAWSASRSQCRMEAPGRVRGMRRRHEPRGQPYFVLPPNLWAPREGGLFGFKFSSTPHPRKFGLKRFRAVRRSWRRNGVACFWATSLEKIFGGVTAIVSYRPGGRMQQSAVPSCAILSGEAREASGSETPRVHNVARWCGGVADRGARSSWGSCRLSGFWARPQLRPWSPWTAAFTITGRSGSARRKRCVVGAGKRGGRAANL